jgi:hypothetical protein
MSLASVQRQLAALQSVRKAAESELTCQKLIAKEREQAVKAKVALALMNESPTEQAERLEFQRRLAISADVAAKLAGEVGRGNEDAPGDDLTLDFGEPEFDLIQARGIGGREVEVDVGMLVQELSYECVLVCREVVEDDVDLLPGRAQGDDFLQESNEIPAGVAVGAGAWRFPFSQNRVAIRIADGEFLDYLNACARFRTQTVKVELLVELSP